MLEETIIQSKHSLLSISLLLFFVGSESTVATPGARFPLAAFALGIPSEGPTHHAHPTEEHKRGHGDDNKHNQDEQVVQWGREHLVLFLFLGSSLGRRVLLGRRFLSGRRSSLQTQERFNIVFRTMQFL
jgi:hypothetical protein